MRTSPQNKWERGKTKKGEHGHDLSVEGSAAREFPLRANVYRTGGTLFRLLCAALLWANVTPLRMPKKLPVPDAQLHMVRSGYFYTMK